MFSLNSSNYLIKLTISLRSASWVSSREFSLKIISTELVILSGLSYRLSFWNLTRACELPSLVVCLMQASSLLYVRPLKEPHDQSQARDTRSLCLSFVTGTRPMTVGMASELVGVRNSGDNKPHTHTHKCPHVHAHSPGHWSATMPDLPGTEFLTFHTCHDSVLGHWALCDPLCKAAIPGSVSWFFPGLRSMQLFSLLILVNILSL